MTEKHVTQWISKHCTQIINYENKKEKEYYTDFCIDNCPNKTIKQKIKNKKVNKTINIQKHEINPTISM